MEGSAAERSQCRGRVCLGPRRREVRTRSDPATFPSPATAAAPQSRAGHASGNRHKNERVPAAYSASLEVDRSALALMSREPGRRCAAVPVRSSAASYGSRSLFLRRRPLAEFRTASISIQPAIAELSDIDAKPFGGWLAFEERVATRGGMERGVTAAAPRSPRSVSLPVLAAPIVRGARS